ncbi:MAG: hypothetical protein JO125_09545 [Chloroflexi bacterium]|nr:hypothetical protein [Ktedonobacteraceae bacterium]MBV9707637.1 hypothetical protein [Chloroflexota bacterium]
MSQTTLSSHEDTETMKATTDRLVELQRRVEFLHNSFPTWPVELQTIGRFVVVLLLPALLPIVLPPLFSWIVGALK